jgi:predicted alpha-1,2-mannosidase
MNTLIKKWKWAALFFLLAPVCECQASQQETDLTPYVHPNIGSVHSRWFFYTPAATPFGMAKLAPSTNGTYGNKDGWEAVGYDDGQSSIDGFPCLHEFQIGGIALMPFTGEVKTRPSKLEHPEDGFRSRFDKKDETAHPGYYSVLLKDYDVKVELTASARMGFQRYTFPKSDRAHILFNIGNREGESGAVRDAYVKQSGPKAVEGWVTTEPEYVKKYQAGASVSMYFYAQLDKAPESSEVFYQDGAIRTGKEIRGAGAMLCLNYRTSEQEKINVKIGLSYTSIANARINLETEAKKLTFDRAEKAAKEKWNEALNRIQVFGGTEADKVKFYTGLYHALLGRGLASDVNGAYPKNDGTVGQIPLDKQGKPAYNHYNTDAVWGAYWNLTQLWALAYPEYYNDFVNSQLLIYKDAGWLGDGIAASRYVSGVGTNMVSIALAGAYNSGIRDYNIAEAYQAARKNELGWKGRIVGAGKMDVKLFLDKGYVPYENTDVFNAQSVGSKFSASHTLEYCFSAYAVAQWAKALGHTADYRRLMKLSDGWEHLFDDSLKMIRPRLPDGRFIDHFNPLESWRGFQEGNAMQYTFFVPQNPERLIARMGRDEFNSRLDSIFTIARKSVFGGGKESDAFAGIQSLYDQGNQPSLDISWLFNFSGRPYLTQKWTRLICNEFYGTTGAHGYGYGQDEDQGQLGAWYVMTATGLFDVQGGTCTRPTFQIGSPLFNKIVIRLSPMNASGHRFIIETTNNGPKAYYVQSATLNGKALDNCWLYRDALYKGGILKLKMGMQPNRRWGATTPPPLISRRR